MIWYWFSRPTYTWAEGMAARRAHDEARFMRIFPAQLRAQCRGEYGG